MNSKPENGTSIQIHLPRTLKEAYTVERASSNDINQYRGKESILVVDDEPDLLELANEYLQDMGYNVILAQNGLQAMEQLAKNSGIELLFSDIVMPGGMSGYELAKAATSKYAGLKVLLTSGLAHSIPHKDHRLFPLKVLPKPYNKISLCRKIRTTLDQEEKANAETAPDCH